MRIVIFCHSLVSDWNHGNAHFLRGVTAELSSRGHTVDVWEPRDGWSRRHLCERHGEAAVEAFHRALPGLVSREYDLAALDLEEVLDDAQLVLVHEWNDPALVAAIGAHRARHSGYRLLFHDTHHRACTAPAEMARMNLSAYDGVLAFGEVIRAIYLERGWSARAWTWHEAADTRVFRADFEGRPDQDLVWVGNWGDDERAQELHEFLLQPARRLRLRGSVHGVRYPLRARFAIRRSGLRYRGWIPNYRAPELFASSRLTVHVPRRPYAQALHGVPTIRMFEALACGIPLISAPWEDSESLFMAGRDYLSARDGEEMTAAMREVAHDQQLADSLRREGLRTIAARHTCAHRVDELMAIYAELHPPAARQP